MLLSLLERIRQGYRTMPFPRTPPPLAERFRGRPVLEQGRCADGCRACLEACPVGAISVTADGPVIDQGLCLFCPSCSEACPQGAVAFSRDYRLAARTRTDLVRAPAQTPPRAEPLEKDLRRLFGRSLKLRQVSAGGCNACEADTNVLNTLAWDLGRFGIQFVASPRHADGLLVTGPVSDNMREALLATWEAVPAPKLVIACGACAIGGGPFRDLPAVHNGLEGIIPVDLFIPGCPPHPATIMDGLLRLLGRID
ncbi:MAG: 4Fe-4S dicluster domain-containing protein [Geobacter sp.]|jgi:Ni,Fe-hydrogenase III small subunit/ferredoxin